MKTLKGVSILTKLFGKMAVRFIIKATLIAMGLIVGLAVFTRFILEILFGGLF